MEGQPAYRASGPDFPNEQRLIRIENKYIPIWRCEVVFEGGRKPHNSIPRVKGSYYGTSLQNTLQSQGQYSPHLSRLRRVQRSRELWEYLYVWLGRFLTGMQGITVQCWSFVLWEIYRSHKWHHIRRTGQLTRVLIKSRISLAGKATGSTVKSL